MLEITRAESSIGSPRPNWVSREDRKIALPPNWLMPASYETRVRVLDVSKSMPITLPTNGWNTSLLCCLRLSSIARCKIWLSSKVDKSRKVRKRRRAIRYSTIIAEKLDQQSVVG